MLRGGGGHKVERSPIDLPNNSYYSDVIKWLRVAQIVNGDIGWRDFIVLLRQSHHIRSNFEPDLNPGLRVS